MTLVAQQPVQPQLFDGMPSGLILGIEAARENLKLVQRSLSALPIRYGQRVYCLDGVNAFDPYPFAQEARAVGADPEWILDHVLVSRSFTIHQIRASVERLLPPLLETSPRPLVVILGIETLFLDESLPMWEHRHVLRKMLDALESFRDQGLPILMTYAREPDPHCWWKAMVEGVSDQRAVLKMSNTGVAELTWTKKSERQSDGKNSPDIQYVPSN